MVLLCPMTEMSKIWPGPWNPLVWPLCWPSVTSWPISHTQHALDQPHTQGLVHMMHAVPNLGPMLHTAPVQGQPEDPHLLPCHMPDPAPAARTPTSIRLHNTWHPLWLHQMQCLLRPVQNASCMCMQCGLASQVSQSEFWIWHAGCRRSMALIQPIGLLPHHSSSPWTSPVTLMQPTESNELVALLDDLLWGSHQDIEWVEVKEKPDGK